MRSDMDKIVRDTRTNRRYERKPRAKHKHRNSDDERPNKESLSASHTKYASVRYQVFRRWLVKQVGRRWDDVYSEIRSTICDESVYKRVVDIVELGDVKIIDGWPHKIPKYWSHGHWMELRRDELYVDEQRVLRTTPEGATPSEKRRERAKKTSVIMLDSMTAAAKINGVWFKAELAYVPVVEDKVIDYSRYNPYRSGETKVIYKTVKVQKHVRDALLSKINGVKKDSYCDISDWDRVAAYKDKSLYAPSIRTMSKKEIKQRILENIR